MRRSVDKVAVLSSNVNGVANATIRRKYPVIDARGAGARTHRTSTPEL
jgi:hypothetical protein